MMLVTRRQGVLVATGAFFAPVLLFLVWSNMIPRWWFHAGEANAIARAVAAHRLKYGSFPDQSDEPLMRSLGFEYNIEPRPQLNILDKTQFHLTYIDGFDGPCWVFSSSTRDWKDDCSVPHNPTASSAD